MKFLKNLFYNIFCSKGMDTPIDIEDILSDDSPNYAYYKSKILREEYFNKRTYERYYYF